jgi:epoxyqueuosine reductase
MISSLSPESLRETIQEQARNLGFARAGFTPAGAARNAPRLREWIEKGRHGEMAWMARGEEVRGDPRKLLENAKTLISLLTDYSTEPQGESRRWVGRISRYAWGMDYHHVIGRRLRKLIRFLRQQAPEAEAVAAVDFKPILEREWAERSGLGWIGKHTNLITEDRGSWFFISEIVTTLDLAGGRESRAPNRCGKCVECIRACPTGAIIAPYTLDARRCISYLTIELKGAIPRELRPMIGEWIFGCDVCQDVCPWNRFAVPVTEQRFQLDTARFDGDLVPFLDLDEDAFEARFRGSAVKRAGRDGFLRNVCVALGNRRDATSHSALAKALNDRSALVRSHAAWALGRIGGAEAMETMARRAGVESNQEVLEEIAAAMEECARPS